MTRPVTWTCSRIRPTGGKQAQTSSRPSGAGIASYEALIAQLRQVNSEVLAVAAELASGTIETVLAKSDLELGIEALTRGLRP